MSRRKAFKGEWTLFYLVHLVTLSALAYYLSKMPPLF